MKVDQPNPIQLVKTQAPTQRFSDVLQRARPVAQPSVTAHPGPKGPAVALAAAHAQPPGMVARLHPSPLQPAHPAAAPVAVQARAQAAALDVRSQAHRSTQQVLSTARADANWTAARLSDVRTDGQAQAVRLTEVRVEPPPLPSARDQLQPLDRKMLDLICKELKADPGVASKLGANPNQPVAADRVPFPVQVTQAHSTDGDVRSAQAVELIEKIETFVRSQRPALALTLNNSLGARVEIERIGPREVALKVVGKDGPPKAEDLGRIREEMRARGLKVGALSVA